MSANEIKDELSSAIGGLKRAAEILDQAIANECDDESKKWDAVGAAYHKINSLRLSLKQYADREPKSCRDCDQTSEELEDDWITLWPCGECDECFRNNNLAASSRGVTDLEIEAYKVTDKYGIRRDVS